MRKKPIFRLYKIEIKLMTHSIWNYYDTKHSFTKNMDLLRDQYKNIVGYRYLRGQYNIV